MVLGSRTKRATCTTKQQPVCTLLLVADYKFYVNVGGKSLQNTATYLVNCSIVHVLSVLIPNEHNSSAHLYCYSSILVTVEGLAIIECGAALQLTRN